MNAINSMTSLAPSGDQRGHEPSMEEILASIRRIIADDQSASVRAVPSPPAAPHDLARERSPAHAPDVNVAPAADEEPPPANQQPAHSSSQPVNHHASDWAATNRGHGSIAAPQYPMPDGPFSGERAAPSLVAGQHLSIPAATSENEPSPPYSESAASDLPVETDRSASSLFSAATDASLTAAFNTLAATRLADNSEDLLDLARDMMRPMLQAWLDDNLPSLVERLVRAEIERVARGPR